VRKVLEEDGVGVIGSAEVANLVEHYGSVEHRRRNVLAKVFVRDPDTTDQLGVHPQSVMFHCCAAVRVSRSKERVGNEVDSISGIRKTQNAGERSNSVHRPSLPKVSHRFVGVRDLDLFDELGAVRARKPVNHRVISLDSTVDLPATSERNAKVPKRSRDLFSHRRTRIGAELGHDCSETSNRLL
jgi:hypothetical protein